MSIPFVAPPASDDRSANSTSTEMMRLAKQMDEQAWRKLVDRYSWLILQWCRSSGLSAENSDDVLQSVLTQLTIYLPKFKDDGDPAAFRRWLRSITKSQIVNCYRESAVQPNPVGGSTNKVDLALIPEPEDPSTVCGPRGPNPLFEPVWEMIERLEDEFAEATWLAFWMTAVENRNSVEVGEELGMTPNAVRLAKGRVLQRLRSEAALLKIELHRLSS